MGPTGCPETSVRNNHYTLRNNLEACSSRLPRDGSLKSRVVKRMFWKVDGLTHIDTCCAMNQLPISPRDRLGVGQKTDLTL